MSGDLVSTPRPDLTRQQVHRSNGRYLDKNQGAEPHLKWGGMATHGHLQLLRPRSKSWLSQFVICVSLDRCLHLSQLIFLLHKVGMIVEHRVLMKIQLDNSCKKPSTVCGT